MSVGCLDALVLEIQLIMVANGAIRTGSITRHFTKTADHVLGLV